VEARLTFCALIEKGSAAVIDPHELAARIAALPAARPPLPPPAFPAPGVALDALEGLAAARAYSRVGQ